MCLPILSFIASKAADIDCKYHYNNYSIQREIAVYILVYESYFSRDVALETSQVASAAPGAQGKSVRVQY